MRSRCLLDRLRQASAQGPFGAHTSGDRSESVTQWSGYFALGQSERALVDEVWNGSKESALVATKDGAYLCFVEHSDAGVPCGGKRYGYTVRLLPLGVEPTPPRRFPWVLGLVFLALLSACFEAGRRYPEWTRGSRNDSSRAAAPPSHRPPDPRREAPVAARETEELRSLRREVRRLAKELAEHESKSDKLNELLSQAQAVNRGTDE